MQIVQCICSVAVSLLCFEFEIVWNCFEKIELHSVILLEIHFYTWGRNLSGTKIRKIFD